MISRSLAGLLALVVCLAWTTLAPAKTADEYLAEARRTSDPAKLTQLYSLAMAAGIHDKAKLAEAYYQRGCAFFRLERHALAIEDFDEAVRINPRAAVFYESRGLAYQKLNKTAPAQANLARAAKLRSGQPGRRRACAPPPAAPKTPGPAPSGPSPSARATSPSPAGGPVTVPIRPSSPPPATPAAPTAPAGPAKPSLTAGQKAAALALAKAIVAEGQGRFRRAERLFSQALRRGLATAREKARAYLHRGRVRLVLRRRSAALSDLTLALRLSPRSAQAHYYRGHVYYDMRMYSQAVAEYTRALRLRPRMYQAHIGRGMANQDMGRYHRAVADYTRAIRLRPRSAQGHNLRGMANLSRRRYHDALRDFNTALRYKPGNPHIMGNRGLVFLRLRQYRRALADFNRALAKAPNNAVLHNNRGLAHLQLRRFQSAIADFTRSIALHPRDPIAHLNRGDAKLLMRRYRAAIDDYTRTLRLLPGGGELAEARVTGYGRRRRGGDRGGVSVSRSVVFYNVQRARAAAYKHRGLAYQRLGMYAQARADLARARRLGAR